MSKESWARPLAFGALHVVLHSGATQHHTEADAAGVRESVGDGAATAGGNDGHCESTWPSPAGWRDRGAPQGLAARGGGD